MTVFMKSHYFLLYVYVQNGKKNKRRRKKTKTYKLKEQKWTMTILARLLQNDLESKAKLCLSFN